MRQVAFSARWVLVGLLFLSATAVFAKAAPDTLALVNVRVISMDPDAPRTTAKRQTVIVEGGRIVEIGRADKVSVPNGAEVINGRNRVYVLPGLVDMHVHNVAIPQLPEGVSAEEIYSLYLANGVTTLFDLAGFREIFQWRRDVRRGRVVGPDLYFTTPLIGEEDYDSLESLEADLRKWKAQGYEYVKSHAIRTKAFFERVYELARELDLPVVTHALRPGFPLQDTLDQSPLMIAHVEEILSTSVQSRDGIAEQLEEPLQSVANSRVWVSGTLDVYEVIADIRDDETFRELLNRPEMRYIPPSVREAWEFQNRFRAPDFSGDRDFWLEALDVQLYIVRRLIELGALDRLLLGTDAGVTGVVPGFSVHDELRLLVQAGLTPWEALLTGTYNPAVFFDRLEESGTVEVGKRADLVLVKRNPLKKIQRLKNPVGVVVNGHLLTKQDLEARLEALASRWVQ